VASSIRSRHQSRPNLSHGADDSAALPSQAVEAHRGRADRSVLVVTDRASLADGPDLSKKFRDRKDGCIEVVMKPEAVVTRDWSSK